MMKRAKGERRKEEQVNNRVRHSWAAASNPVNELLVLQRRESNFSSGPAGSAIWTEGQQRRNTGRTGTGEGIAC
jgi:hypothetical protein